MLNINDKDYDGNATRVIVVSKEDSAYAPKKEKAYAPVVAVPEEESSEQALFNGRQCKW